MELKTAIANYLEAKKQLESMLGKEGVIDNLYNGTVSMWTTNINLLSGAENIVIEHDKNMFMSRLVIGRLLGTEIRCVSYMDEIEKAFPAVTEKANKNNVTTIISEVKDYVKAV